MKSSNFIAYMNEEENVVLETPSEPVEETVETPATETEVDVEQLQATNKKLFERAKKAEADLKVLKSQPASKSPLQPNVEEVVLQANGMPDELLQELKVVAGLRNTTLIKAQSDPIFVAVKEKFERDQKQKDASLPASRGSGGVKPKKDFATPGLSREEHRKMVLG